MKVSGKTWVVTGAASGIGRELVLQLLRRGGRVAAVDVREDELSATAELAGPAGALSTHVVDITDPERVGAVVDEVIEAHGAVDGLINNAGIIQPFAPLADLDQADIDRVLAVNLMGTVYMLKAFLPHLLRRPEAHVANVSSLGGYFPFPGQSVYGASKAAVKLLTEGLYGELLDTHVSVSVIMPGPTQTNIAAHSEASVAQPTQSRLRITTAADAARMAIEGIEKGRLHIYLGGLARATSVAIRIAPRRSIRFVRNQMAKLAVTGERE